MKRKPISEITVSELCKESGVNRATFYNHYDSPLAIVKEIAREYISDMRELYLRTKKSNDGDRELALQACLEYLQDRRPVLDVLFSDNAENFTTSFVEEMVDDIMTDYNDRLKAMVPDDVGFDYMLYGAVTASAAYSLIRVWIAYDIKKTPAEMVAFVKRSYGRHIFSWKNSPDEEPEEE